MSEIVKASQDFLNGLNKDYENLFETLRKRREAINLEREKSLKNDIVPNFKNCAVTEKCDTLKENQNPNTSTKHNSQRGSTQSESLPHLPSLSVKLEKSSLVPEVKPLDGTFAMPQMPAKAKKIKKEPAPRQSSRVTRSTRKPTVPEADDQIRESDVILQPQNISIVEIIDSDSPEEEKPKANTRTKRATTKANKTEVQTETRSTRTKTKQQAMKRLRNEDEEENENKRSRSYSNDKKSNGNTSTQTVYQDALSTFDSKPNKKSEVKSDVNNATFAVANTNVLDATYNLNSKLPTTKAALKQNDYFTDDESDDEVEARVEANPPTPPKSSANKGTKQVFSPYSHTPMKDKVKAFEQLTQPASSIPVKHRIGTPTGNKKVSKHITPITSKQLMKMASVRTTPSTKGLSTGKESSSSVLSSKSASAMKASQAEYLRRKEREQEAIKKREALLLAQSEEKRKKREERQLKAQQQREAQEKEKLKQIELQRQKEERYEQVIAEKEKKIMKIREENERKRIMAKKKANEGMKTDDRPKYKIYKTPLLPLQDCYDSDDERCDNVKVKVPDWVDSSVLTKMLHDQICIDQKITNTFFSCSAQTANLEELFGIIDPRKLKRTSSAIWNSPPRYTQLHNTHGALHEEDDE